jgi:hypothetical protein
MSLIDDRADLSAAPSSRGLRVAEALILVLAMCSVALISVAWTALVGVVVWSLL